MRGSKLPYGLPSQRGWSWAQSAVLRAFYPTLSMCAQAPHAPFARGHGDRGNSSIYAKSHTLGGAEIELWQGTLH